MTWIHKKIAEHLTREFAAVGIEIEPIDLGSFKAIRHKRGSEERRLHSWECRVVLKDPPLDGFSHSRVVKSYSGSPKTCAGGLSIEGSNGPLHLVKAHCG